MPNELDPTLVKIKKMSKYNNQDKDTNWLIANIYPQRSTNPNGMHQSKDNQIHLDNLKAIENAMKKTRILLLCFPTEI